MVVGTLSAKVGVVDLFGVLMVQGVRSPWHCQPVRSGVENVAGRIERGLVVVLPNDFAVVCHPNGWADPGYVLTWFVV